MTDSYIQTNASGTCVISLGGINHNMFAGPDAVQLFKAMQIKSALKMWRVGLKDTRGVRLKNLLSMTSEYTGKPYKRTEVDTAIADLVQWIEAMKAALPVEKD